MLEIPEEALENLLAALTRMNIGFALDGTVEAALHVMHENRLEGEREKLADLGELPTLWEWEEGEEDADRASPGIPVALPVEPLQAPPTEPIPLGGPSPLPADTPQEGERLPTTTSTWEEMESALRKFRERDRECQRARAELFAAFQTWMEGQPEPRRQQRRKRPRGNTRQKSRPDATRKPGRNWRGSERSG